MMIKAMTTSQKQRQSHRVMLISSNPMTRVGLRVILEGHPNISLVGEVSGEMNAAELVDQEKPEVILIDLDLTGIDVLNLIRKLHDIVKDSRILIFCGLNDEKLANEALCSGAAGVLLKIQPPAVIFAAIESLCANSAKASVRQTPPSPLPRIMPNGKTHDGEPTRIITSLTNRERGVIALIGEGFRNKDIADRLCISETTVRHHLTSIFSKLEVSNRQKLLIVAHQYGLVELKASQSA